MERSMNCVLKKLLAGIAALGLAAGLLGLAVPQAAGAAEPVALTVKGDGVKKEVSFTMADLKALPQKTYTYSGYNHWPALKVFKDMTGPTLKSILDAAGLQDNATLLVFRPFGGDFVRMDYTRAQLLDEARYYFPDGEIPGDCAEWPPKRSERGKVPVETIIALNDSDGRVCFGQRSPNEPTGGNCAMIQQMLAGGTIEVKTTPLEQWEPPTANIPPGTVAPGTRVALQKADDIADNMMVYYTLDGSDPTYGSYIFNISFPTFRPEQMNKPIPVNGNVTVKARLIGFGKLDSEVVTFQYNTGAPASVSGTTGTAGNTANNAGGGVTETGKTAQVSRFTDLAGHWAKDSIDALVEKGVIDGAGTAFRPDENVTRAQFAQWLVRAAGFKDGKGQALPFNDVPVGAWYRDDVAAAFKSGLVMGVGENAFAPDESITREQIAVIVTRALKMKSTEDLSHAVTEQDINKFADKEDISLWARQEVALAVSRGIVSGMSGGTFAPQLSATRAEAATMILRLCRQLQ